MADATIYDAARAEIGVLRQRLYAARTPLEKVDAATVLLARLATVVVAAPTPELRERWLAEYRALQPQVANLKAQVTTNNPPSTVLVALDRFSDAVLDFSQKVLDGTSDIVVGAGQLAKASPWIILALIAAAAVVLVLVGPRLLKAAK